jgi:hypothetical protein
MPIAATDKPSSRFDRSINPRFVNTPNDVLLAASVSNY